MAPPRKGGAAAGEQAKERLTAVVMADSFTQVINIFFSKSINSHARFQQKVLFKTINPLLFPQSIGCI